MFKNSGLILHTKVKSALFIIGVFILAGCSSIKSDLYGEKLGCERVAGHFTAEAKYVETQLNCPKGIPKNFITSSKCTWVDGYFRLSGTYVDGHYRCDTSASKTSNSSDSYKTTYGSNCHYVSGYYRKNGTYVRGHRRCRK